MLIQKISSLVSVALVFNQVSRKVAPKWVIWDGKKYEVTKIGLHHTYREGRTLYHVFSAETPTLFLRLILNTETLHWKLEEISDGLPD